MESSLKQDSWLRCNCNNPAAMICIHKDCTSQPIICADAKCQCRQPHLTHSQLPIEGFLEKVRQEPRLPDSAKNHEKATKILLDSLQQGIQKCRQQHHTFMEQQYQQHNRHHAVMKKLRSKEKEDVGSLSGEIMRQIISDLETNSSQTGATEVTSKTEYGRLEKQFGLILESLRECWKTEEIKSTQSKKRSKRWVVSVPLLIFICAFFFSIVKRPSQISPNLFENRSIKALDVAFLPFNTTEVSIIGCSSVEWDEIGERLAVLPNLETLYMKDCDSANEITNRLSQSNSIINLTMTNCGLGDEGVRRLTFLKQLRFLNLNGNPSLTVDAFRTVVEKATKVEVLEMRMAHITYLDIDDLSVGAKGALFIAENFPQLSELHIQGNNLGDEGAGMIASSLSKLKVLYMRTNGIHETGALAIAENLPDLNFLDLSNNLINDNGLIAISSSLNSLAKLYLAGINTSHETVQQLALSLPKLIHLDLSNNIIGQTGAIAISTHLKSLTKLSVDNTNLTREGALHFSSLPALKELSIENNGLDSACLEELRSRLSNTTIHG